MTLQNVTTTVLSTVSIQILYKLFGHVNCNRTYCPREVRGYPLLSANLSKKKMSVNWSDLKFLKKNSEASVHIIELSERIKTQTGGSVKIIRRDQGMEEYGRECFDEWKLNYGVTHQTTCCYIPQQNGIVFS